jgi:hypothetical protein
MINAEGRHQSTQDIVEFFDTAHLDDGLAEVARPVEYLVIGMLDRLPDGPELTAGLRKLLEAKDCFVRQAVKVRREVNNA